MKSTQVLEVFLIPSNRLQLVAAQKLAEARNKLEETVEKIDALNWKERCSAVAIAVEMPLTTCKG